MNLSAQAARLFERLVEHNERVVFAESCTAGLIAATLAEVPGVSEFLCGSAVTYREATKQAWLGVSADDLAKHTAVSEPVAQQMALGVLAQTPEAHIAASVTGHLGPSAPPGFDGVVYIALARRTSAGPTIVSVTRHQLRETMRRERQQEAASMVIRLVVELLDG